MDSKIRRVKDKTGNFTTILNELFQKKDVSAKAKGVYVYLLTLPDDWQIYMSEVCTHFTEGKGSIESAIKELERLGYIKKEKRKGERGRFEGWDYTVYESPTGQFTDVGEIRSRSLPKSANPQLPSIDLSPSTENEQKTHKEKKGDFVFSFPEGMPEKYKNELLIFIEHRKEMKKPMTQRALDMIVNKLEPFTPEERTTAITNAIISLWSDVYPQKKKDKFGKEVPDSRPSKSVDSRPTHCDICGRELVNGKCACGRQVFLTMGKYVFEDTGSKSDMLKMIDGLRLLS